MKNQMKKLMCSLLVLFMVLTGTGCGKSATPSAAESAVSSSTGVSISQADDQKAKSLINDYFKEMFAGGSVDDYLVNTVTGKVPNNLRKYIAEQTLKEGDGNPEISIHYPRLISINGMVIISYDIVMLGEDDKKPQISADFIAKNGDNLVYFCKITAMTSAVSEEAIEKLYKSDSNIKIDEVARQGVEKIKVEIKYDVEIENKKGEFKIRKATEASIKPGVENRLSPANNESVTRLPFLDISVNSKGEYNNKADGDAYEAEKTTISTFFTNLAVLDRERMNLLSFTYTQGSAQVQECFDSLGISKNKDKPGNILKLTSGYLSDIPYESLPLRDHMEKIKEIKNISVKPHPAYSDTQKLYFVNFDAVVQNMNGIIDEDFTYSYDYLVLLSNSGNSVQIQKIKLDEYYLAQN